MDFATPFPARETPIGSLLRGQPFLGFRSRTTTVFVRAAKGGGSHKKSSRSYTKAATRRKESPWNDVIEEPQTTNGRKPSKRGSRTPSSAPSRSSRKSQSKSGRDDSSILVSAVMPVAIEKVLQAGEPAATPSWQTFASSLCGVWRGVGAAFSPATAEMEAIALGSQDEMLYDSRVLSTVEECKETSMSQIHRKTVWAVGNPLGEQGKGRIQVQESFAPPQDITDDDEDSSNTWRIEDLGVELVEDSAMRTEDDNTLRIEDLGIELVEDSTLKEMDTGAQLQNVSGQTITSDLESSDLVYDTMMEKDVLEFEPGLVFFEDGSYSRGPLTLLDGESSIAVSPVFKIEQCLVRGGHTRVRIVHTIEVEGGGESVQLLRLAVYNEEWMGPVNMKSISDSGGHHLKLFSQHTRLQPKELVGTWKVFELSAIAIVADDMETGESVNQRPPYVYMTTEMQKRRLSPELPVQFVDEDIMDMQDVTVMWLPGGINAYVDVKDDGTLTVGIGWYEDGVNLVMERDYNTDGRLSEVHNKSEVKGGWVGGRM